MRLLNSLYVIVALSAVLFSGGCASLSLAVPAAAVNIGSLAYRALDSADIAIVMDQDVTGDQLARIESIAVWMGKDSATRPYGRIGDLAAVVADNLVLELMSRGYTVYGHERMHSSTGQSAHLDESEHDRCLAAAHKLGAHAVVTGNAAGNQVGTPGILGSRRTSTVVQSLSLRMIDAANGRTLILITIDYRTGQAPRVAAEGAAIIIQAKLDDPDADIGELIDLRGRFRAKDPEGSGI